MRTRLVDQFIEETQIAAHVYSRDFFKRSISAVMVLFVCTLGGEWLYAAILGGMIVLFEIVLRPINKNAIQYKGAMPLHYALSFWLVNWMSLFPFLGLGLVLVENPSIAFVLAGYMWIFGTCVYITNAFGLMPIYNWALMIPTFGTVFMMFYMLATNNGYVIPVWHWVLLGAAMCVYIANTIETLLSQKDTHSALIRAREVAHTRLEELEELSRNDSLTGLMNRRAFDEIINAAIEKPGVKLTVFLIDLDGFKPINDSYSHSAGDAVLRKVAERLQKAAGENGHTARLGGDEFAIARFDLKSSSGAYVMGEKIAKLVREPVPFEQKSLTVGASVGIAQTSDAPTSTTDLMSAADQAMYRAKQDPERHAMVYDKKEFPPRASLDERNRLIEAMQHDEIMPHYQPKVDITSGEIAGFEALSRWNHPDRGLLSPAYFIPLINELGLQGAFMMHTARHVMRHIGQMLGDGLNPGQISINVPEVTLATLSGREELLRLIEMHPDLRRYITFEITEDVFIGRSRTTIQQSIAAFRREGVRISLDDFGTGFASFQHLRELEFDELKLDTGFVKGLGVDPAADVLVDGFLAIGRGLGVQIIAEGVENEEQLDLLRNMGCEIVQGHYFGAAVPFQEAKAFLTQWQPAKTSVA